MVILVRDVTTCSTSRVRQLDQQIIAKINSVSKDALVSFAHLDVSLGAAVWPYVQPPGLQALEKAIQARGTKMFINSAYRTIAQQLILYQHYRSGARCGIRLAATPGRSNHQSGLAIDIEDAYSWRSYLEKYGWQWLGSRDPVHFDYRGSGTKDIRNTAVLAFQKLWNENNSSKLDEDGIYGEQTALSLSQAPIMGFATGEKVEDVVPEMGDPPPPRILFLTQPTQEGKDVQALQEALSKAGITLEIDGFFGPLTEKAVKEFQKSKGLVIDGVIGPGTFRELMPNNNNLIT
ncbi:MAG: peptidoglycan-binding protein, partial [Spirulinaceae cyanobacterium]